MTIDAYEQRFLFGEVVNGDMQLNAFGMILSEEWLRTPALRPYVELDDFQVMPNHFHAIVSILPAIDDESAGRARLAPTRFELGSRSLGSIVGGFKAKTTSTIRKVLGDQAFGVWQRGFFETVIRDDIHLDQVRDYIRGNPANWGR